MFYISKRLQAATRTSTNIKERSNETRENPRKSDIYSKNEKSRRAEKT